MDWNLIATPHLRSGRGSQKRNDFERDYDRIIFSSTFKKLNQKTQVFPMPRSYFVHNRMTHSIETSCIGRSLGKIVADFLLQNRKISSKNNFTENLGTIVETACLAHDIGNPPFGHSGEEAISNFFIKNKWVTSSLPEKHQQDFLKFEGNAQGFRLLSKKDSELEMTDNILISFTKYPKESIVSLYSKENAKNRNDQKKFGFFQNEKEIFKEIAEYFKLTKLSNSHELAYARHPLAYLVEAADDICYLIIDLEDGVRLDLVNLEEIHSVLYTIIKKYDKNGDFEKKYKNITDKENKMGYLRAKIINILIEEIIEIFKINIENIENGNFNSTLIGMIEFQNELKSLKEISFEKLYSYRPVLEIEAAGFSIINGLLEFIFQIKKDPANKQYKKISSLLPKIVTKEDISYESILDVTDFISGMTDWYAIDLYNKITGVTLPELY